MPLLFLITWYPNVFSSSVVVVSLVSTYRLAAKLLQLRLQLPRVCRLQCECGCECVRVELSVANFNRCALREARIKMQTNKQTATAKNTLTNVDNKLSKFCAYYTEKKSSKRKNKCKMQQHFVHLHDMVSISVLPFVSFLLPTKLPAVGQLSTVCAARPAGHCCLCSFSYTFSTSLFLLDFPVHFCPMFVLAQICYAAVCSCFSFYLTSVFYRPHLICIENVESICSDRIITYECDRYFLNGG